MKRLVINLPQDVHGNAIVISRKMEDGQINQLRKTILADIAVMKYFVIHDTMGRECIIPGELLRKSVIYIEDE